MACLNPGLDDQNCCHWDPRRGRLRATLGATPGGYTGKPGRAKRPYFTGLSRSHFKVAEREGFSALAPGASKTEEKSTFFGQPRWVVCTDSMYRSPRLGSSGFVRTVNVFQPLSRNESPKLNVLRARGSTVELEWDDIRRSIADKWRVTLSLTRHTSHAALATFSGPTCSMARM